VDIWFYYEVTHSLHLLLNPMRASRVDELGRVLDLRPGTRVVDIACGHGEFLIRWAGQYGITGVGIDLSPFTLERAKKHMTSRVPNADIEFLHMDGADFVPEQRFDVACLIGASWIWKGYDGTLDAMIRLAHPGSPIVFGEPYWKLDPPDEYMVADEGLSASVFTTLEGLREHALGKGLELVWMMESSMEDWDRYEMLQATAVDRFARAYPDHPDLPEILARRKKSDEIYFRWGRDHCGFATWVFRTPS